MTEAAEQANRILIGAMRKIARDERDPNAREYNTGIDALYAQREYIRKLAAEALETAMKLIYEETK